jgi:dihydrofolate reductase
MSPRRSPNSGNSLGNDLNVMGSGELIQTLMRHGLIDEYHQVTTAMRRLGRR